MAADRTPAHPPMPYRIPEPESPGQPARRSRSLYAPAALKDAPQPGLIDAVLVALGHRAPNLDKRITTEAARSRLFRGPGAAKASSSDDGPRGAWVLNREIAADILDPLTAQLVLFQAGAEQVPMDGIDSLTVRKLVGVPGAYWAGENTALDTEDAEWAVASLTLKELRAPTLWSNRWLRNLVAGTETKLRDQIVHAMRLKLEYSALFGDGSVPADGTSTGAQPLGVRYTPGVTLTALSPARTPELGDLETAQAALEDNNVEESPTWGWISHPRTIRTFEYMSDQNGQPILRSSWAGGPERTLVDFPYFKTTGVPKNLGGATNESVLFFGDWAELAIGIGLDVELLVSDQRYIEYNQTFVMGIAYVDSAVWYPDAFHVTTGVLR
jgi:HK97 family phage major capsid protein